MSGFQPKQPQDALKRNLGVVLMLPDAEFERFRAIADAAKISHRELARQMVQHCMREMDNQP